VVKLRLKRFGRRHKLMFRLNAMDNRNQRDGRSIEELGWYNPHAETDNEKFSFDHDRVRYWLSNGAQPSPTVASLLKKAGIEPRPGKAHHS
jgi:small subunit ribosomal protein S16